MAFDLSNSVQTTDIRIIFEAYNGSFKPKLVQFTAKDEPDGERIENAHLELARGETMKAFQDAVMDRLGAKNITGARVRFEKSDVAATSPDLEMA